MLLVRTVTEPDGLLLQLSETISGDVVPSREIEVEIFTFIRQLRDPESVTNRDWILSSNGDVTEREEGRHRIFDDSGIGVQQVSLFLRGGSPNTRKVDVWSLNPDGTVSTKVFFSSFLD